MRRRLPPPLAPPILALTLLVTVLACSPGGGSGSGSAGGGEIAALLEEGGRIYSSQCALCHGSDGRGMGSLNPPLTDSELLAESPEEAIRLVLHGSTALPPTEQAGYANVMPPYPFLSDSQIAAVLSYARDRFAAGAEPIDPATVQSVRTRR